MEMILEDEEGVEVVVVGDEVVDEVEGVGDIELVKVVV